VAAPVVDPLPARNNTLPLALGGIAVVLLGLVITLALWPSDEATDTVASTDDASSPTDSSKTKPKPDESKAGPPPPPPEYTVVNALEARRVRALDVLIIATDLSGPGDHPAAASYCAQLDIEGLAGWRLPHVGELRSLSDAKMIGRGMYWSSNPADTFGDAHLAWNVRRSYAQPHDKDAVAVCVRGDTSGS
jgi:hypothetical protein